MKQKLFTFKCWPARKKGENWPWWILALGQSWPPVWEANSYFGQLDAGLSWPFCLRKYVFSYLHKLPLSFYHIIHVLCHSLVNPPFMGDEGGSGARVISSGQSAGYSPMSQHLSRSPECSTATRWFLEWINIPCTIFVCSIRTSLKSHLDCLVSRHSCQHANQMKGGSFQGTLMSAALVCAASVEQLRSDLKTFAFINNFCRRCEFQISFLSAVCYI